MVATLALIACPAATDGPVGGRGRAVTAVLGLASLGAIFATDQPSSSAHTRPAPGWEPKHPNLLTDLENIQP